MELNFTVTNQRIKYVSNLYIVEKSRNYLTAKFSFSGSEWKNVAKTAIFKKDDNVINVLLDENGRCTVPWELITRGTLKVSVFGGDLVTVDTAEVKILKSGYEEGNAPSEPTSDVYAQILAELQSIRDDFITEEMLGQAVEDWLAENVVEALSPADVEKIVYNYLDEHKDELKGEKGAVFTPHVSDEGVMSWTNDSGLENPPPVDLKINAGGDYALLTEAGYSLNLSVDKNYVLTIDLLNKAGTVLSSKNVDLPLETMFINATYANGVITLTLQNGNTLDVDISDIVRGLVPTSRTIAGIDLEDDITKEELEKALNITHDSITTTKLILNNSFAGTLKINHIGGGVTYQDSNPSITNIIPIHSTTINTVVTTDNNGNESTMSFDETVELFNINNIVDKIYPTHISKNYKKVVFDGSSDESWEMEHSDSVGYYRFVISIDNVKSTNARNINVKCTHGNALNYGNATNTCFTTNGNFYIYTNEYATSLTEWRELLSANPMTVVYELEYDEIVSLSDEEKEKLQSLNTYNGITYIEFDSFVTPSINVTYPSSDVLVRLDALNDQVYEVKADIEKANIYIEELQNAIVTTDSTTLENSHAGRLLFNEIVGGMEQGENPSTDNPQPINGSVIEKIRVHGKNFLENELTSQTNKGVTVTRNNDGSITLKGTATATAFFIVNSSVEITGDTPFILNGCPSGGSLTSYGLRAYDLEGVYRADVGSGVELPSNNTYTVEIRIQSGYTVNATFYPMIRRADIKDDTYEPYQGKEITLSNPITLYNDVLGENVERKYAKFIATSSMVNSATKDGTVYINVPATAKISSKAYCTHNSGIKASLSGATLYFTDSVNGVDADTYKAFLDNNEVEFVYELAESVIEELPTADKIALNSLPTYDGITYVEFIDVGVQPNVSIDYGTSKVGGMTLESLLTARNNDLRLSSLEASVVNNI